MGTLVWYQGFFNKKGTESVQSHEILFETIYKRCQLTYSKPGYAFSSWQNQSPLWWTKLMDRIPTDMQKELFLQRASIETIVCLPLNAHDGTGYCVELATDSLVPETEALLDIIQEVIKDSVAPHISFLPSSSFLNAGNKILESVQGFPSKDGAMMEIQSFDHKSPVTLYPGAQNGPSPGISMPHIFNSTNDEPFSDLNTLLKHEEPYFPWTTSGWSLADISEQFGAIQDSSPKASESVDKETRRILQQHQALAALANTGHPSDWNSMQPQVSPITSMSSQTKGKEVLSQENLIQIEVPSIPIFKFWSPNRAVELPLAQSLPETSLIRATTSSFPGTTSSGRDNQTYENRHFPGGSSQLPTTGLQVRDFNRSESSILNGHPRFNVTSLRPNISSQEHISSVFTNRFKCRDMDQMNRMPWLIHSSFSKFQVPGTSTKSCLLDRPHRKGSPLLLYWKEHIAPKIIRREQRKVQDDRNPGGYDPRGRHTVAQAVSHKLAERHRRSKFNSRLQTLISIVPIIKKKDKVSVLTSTIEYIRQLKCALPVTYPENAAAPVLLNKDDSASTTFNLRTPVLSEIRNGASSTSAGRGVIVESSSDGKSFFINVDADNHPQALIQLLNTIRGLQLKIINMESTCIDSRLHATISVMMPADDTVSSNHVQEAIQRVLDTPYGSDTYSD